LRGKKKRWESGNLLKKKMVSCQSEKWKMFFFLWE
jgi:hypothetical protein